MRRLLLAVVWSSPIVLAQTTLPAPEHALIIGVRAVRQATTQSPMELTLLSGTRITIAPQDVHSAATTWARGKLMEQSSGSVSPSLVFVLHIRAVATPSKTHTDVTLFSGAVVRVASDDVRDLRLSFLRTALAQTALEQRARAPVSAAEITSDSTSDSSSPPSMEAANPVIRAKCAKEWPDDFRMRAYCQKQQDEGLQALRLRPMSAISAHRTIRTKCAGDWPDDFRMRDYCEKQQLEALKVIR